MKLPNILRFYVDLTKRRFDLKKKAESIVKDMEPISYVFADVNNNVGLSLKNGKIRFFNSEEELLSIINTLS